MTHQSQERNELVTKRTNLLTGKKHKFWSARLFLATENIHILTYSWHRSGLFSPWSFICPLSIDYMEPKWCIFIVENVRHVEWVEHLMCFSSISACVLFSPASLLCTLVSWTFSAVCHFDNFGLHPNADFHQQPTANRTATTAWRPFHHLSRRCPFIAQLSPRDAHANPIWSKQGRKS